LASRAGSVSNIIPDEAALEANIRYARKEDLDGLLKTLEDRIQKRKKLAQVRDHDHGGLRSPRVQRRTPVASSPGREGGFASMQGSWWCQLRVVPRQRAVAPTPLMPRSAGKPVIESLGLPGFGYHSNQAEYVMIDAIPRRLYLATPHDHGLERGES
jgi:glutamate carboxypeptidase